MDTATCFSKRCSLAAFRPGDFETDKNIMWMVCRRSLLSNVTLTHPLPWSQSACSASQTTMKELESQGHSLLDGVDFTTVWRARPLVKTKANSIKWLVIIILRYSPSEAIRNARKRRANTILHQRSDFSNKAKWCVSDLKSIFILPLVHKWWSSACSLFSFFFIDRYGTSTILS